MTDIVFKVNAGFGVTESLLIKNSMSIIPRVGEYIAQKGKMYIVRSVIHDLDLDGCVIVLGIPKTSRKESAK